jgi:hypothetical protein
MWVIVHWEKSTRLAAIFFAAEPLFVPREVQTLISHSH